MRPRKSAMVLIPLLGIVIAYCVYFFLFPWDCKEFYMNTKVENVIGFYINETALMFGTIPPGAVGGKQVTLHNNGGTPEFVHITANGTISKWTGVSANNFIMPGMTNATLLVRVSVPEGTAFGEYDGALKICFKRLY